MIIQSSGITLLNKLYMKYLNFKIDHFKMLILHFALISSLFAGAPDTLWTRTYGGYLDDEGFSIQQTNDGGFITCGVTYTFGVGGYDIYLIRSYSNGDTIWTRTYGKPFHDRAWSVQLTTDGGYIITGWTQNSLDGESDLYLIKTDINGDTLWTRTYGGDSSDVGVSVQQTIDGGFITCGVTYTFGGRGEDIYLIRTDSNGDTLWTKTYGGDSSDVGVATYQTSDGGFLIGGYTKSFGAGGYDIYIVRTDFIGDTLWTKTYGGIADENCYSAQKTSNNGLILAGWTESFGGGQKDVYLININSSGDTLWTKTYGGDNEDIAWEVQQISDSGFIIAGDTRSFGVGMYDVYIIRTDPNGDTLWTQTYGGTEDDNGNSVKQTKDGGFIIAGVTKSFSDGDRDVYLIRLDKETTGIQEDLPSSFSKPYNFIVSYEHSNNIISIRYTIQHSSFVKLEAFDIRGKLVKTIINKYIQKGSYKVNWNSKQDDNKLLAGGTYFLKLSVNGSSVSRKIMIFR